MRRIVLAAATAALAVSLTGCMDAGNKPAAKDPSVVSRAQMGRAWPLTVPSGRVQCIGSKADAVLVFYGPDNREYTLNGTAKAQLGEHVPDITAIWAHAGGGLRKDLGPLFDRAFKVC